MVGLTISGRTYNPETYEISLNAVQGLVITSGSTPFRFWSSNNNEWITIPVTFYYCAEIVNSIPDENSVVSIPAFLIESITDGQIDTTIAPYVTGFSYSFSPDLPYAIKDPETVNAGIISRASLPVPYFKDGDRTDFSFSDFFVCYNLSSVSPVTPDTSIIRFIDASKCTYGANTSGGTSETSGTPGDFGEFDVPQFDQGPSGFDTPLFE